MHQFDKVELVKITTPENSAADSRPSPPMRKRSPPASRSALPRESSSALATWAWLAKDLRHRGVVARPAAYLGLELLEFRRQPAPAWAALQKCRGQKRVLPHSQRLRHRARPAFTSRSSRPASNPDGSVLLPEPRSTATLEATASRRSLSPSYSCSCSFSPSPKTKRE